MFDVLPVTSARPTDCGATCMKMLLAYYGQDVALDQLIRECDTRLIGCTAGDLKRCGVAHGLEMVAYQMDAAELIRQDRPAIVHWKYRHWCVFCGRDDDGNVVICNTDRGRYRLPPDTFATMYTGVSLFNGEPEDYAPRAEKNYAQGECFMRNGELCKAIAPIAKGAMLTLNTNYIVTSVEKELAALNQ